MLISMLKYVKVLRHVPILTGHHQGVGLYLVKVTELFKNAEFKILKINPLVVAGVRGDLCGAVRWSPTHNTTTVITYTCYTFCCHNTGIDLQDFKFSVFFLNNSIILTRYRHTP